MLTPLIARLRRGAAAGVVATGAMSGFMGLAQRAGLVGKLPPRKITERLLAVGRRWPERQYRKALSATAHVAFGAAAGAAFAGVFPLAGGRVPRPSHRVVAGAVWGAAIWTAMYGYVLPAAKLMPEPTHDRRFRPTSMVAAHLIYGAVLGALTT